MDVHRHRLLTEKTRRPNTCPLAQHEGDTEGINGTHGIETGVAVDEHLMRRRNPGAGVCAEGTRLILSPDNEVIGGELPEPLQHVLDGAGEGVRDLVHARCSSSFRENTFILYKPGRESQRKKGIRIELKETTRYERTGTSFLDVDEMASLSKAVDYMSKHAQQWAGKPRDYTEVIFSTKGDFQLGFYMSKGKPGAFAKSGGVGSTSAYFSMATLQKVKETVDRGLAHLSAR
jgi:hypothetical protein